MSDSETQTTGTTRKQSPGSLLREARDKLGLSQKKVADQLNLQSEIINALEDNDNERLPAPTYVKGYLRNYARLVNLDANILIKLYEEEETDPPEIIPDVKKHTQVSSRDKPVRAVTYLVTFGLALLLLAWLQSNYVVDEKRKQQNSASNTDSNYGKLSYPIKIVIHPDTPFLKKESTTDAGGYAELPLYDESADIQNEIINTIDLPSSLTIETTVSDDTLINQPDSVPGMSRSGGHDQLLFNVKSESWIEVRDSGNNKLYTGLAQPGEKIQLNGKPPLSVTLGNASGVDVRFKGQLFDTGPYSNSGVARFKLGE